MRQQFRQLAVALALWTGLALLAIGSAQRADATVPCHNTDCFGAAFCQYLGGYNCTLSSGQCNVRAC